MFRSMAYPPENAIYLKLYGWQYCKFVAFCVGPSHLNHITIFSYIYTFINEKIVTFSEALVQSRY